MADRRISQLPVANAPNGSLDVVPIVSGGTTSQASINSVVAAGLRPASQSVLGGVLVGSGLQVTPLGLLSSSATGTLEGLSDTNINNLTNGQRLRYDATQSKWVNSSVLDGGNV